MVKWLTEYFKLCDNHLHVPRETVYSIMSNLDWVCIFKINVFIYDMFFIFDSDCEILVVIVRPGDSVFLLSDYPGAEFSVFIFSSLLELNLEACWELREYALIDKFLRKSKGFNIFQSHKHKFCHLVEQDVVLTKKVFCQECLGEHILLELHGLVKQLESSSNLTGLDEVHLQDFLAFIVDDVAFFLVREIARHQALHKELNYVSI